MFIKCLKPNTESDHQLISNRCRIHISVQGDSSDSQTVTGSNLSSLCTLIHKANAADEQALLRTLVCMLFSGFVLNGEIVNQKTTMFWNSNNVLQSILWFTLVFSCSWLWPGCVWATYSYPVVFWYPVVSQESSCPLCSCFWWSHQHLLPHGRKSRCAKAAAGW